MSEPWEGGPPASSEPSAEPRGPRDFLILVLLVLGALGLRSGSFSLVRDRGDQLLWAGVTANLAARGFPDGYTVRGIDLGYEEKPGGAMLVRFGPAVVGSESTAIVESGRAPSAGTGQLLRNFTEQQGEKYWDSPLFNQPPGFLLVLLGSHAVWGKTDDGFPILARDPRLVGAARAKIDEKLAPRAQEIRGRTDLTEEQRRHELEALGGVALETYDAWEAGYARSVAVAPPTSGPRAWAWAVLPDPWRLLVGEPDPHGIARAQLWATLPVVLADLLTVALLTLLGHAVGGRAGAVLAALAFATDPLGLFCGHRLLSNGPLAAACLATLAAERGALLEAEGSRRTRLSLLVGLLAGVAITIKVSAVFLLPALVVGRFLQDQLRPRSLVVLLAVALVLVAPWWWLQFQVHGNPWGMPFHQQDDRDLVSPWARLIHAREAIYYVTVIGRSPLVVLGLVAGLARLVVAARERWRDGASRETDLSNPLFAVAVILAAARFDEKEARHLLLAYPPLILEAVRALVAVHRGKPAVLVTGAGLGIAALLLWQATQGLGLAFDVARAP